MMDYLDNPMQYCPEHNEDFYWGHWQAKPWGQLQ
jgi:hypothetical protein